MSILLVANGTHQFHNFQYRIPEHDKVFSETIAPGRQVRIPLDLNDRQLAEVIAQLERYGAVPKDDVSNLVSPRGLVYSVNRPVSSDAIDEAREKDVEIRQEISNQQVENAGVAIPQIPGITDHIQTASLEVRELAPTQNEQPVKGGVDTKIVVSQDAGKLERSSG